MDWQTNHRAPEPAMVGLAKVLMNFQTAKCLYLSRFTSDELLMNARYATTNLMNSAERLQASLEVVSEGLEPQTVGHVQPSVAQTLCMLAHQELATLQSVLSLDPDTTTGTASRRATGYDAWIELMVTGAADGLDTEPGGTDVTPDAQPATQAATVPDATALPDASEGQDQRVTWSTPPSGEPYRVVEVQQGYESYGQVD